MDLVCHGRAGFFPVGGADDGVELLFLLLLSVGVGSGEDRRWMDLLQAGVGSGVFGGAGSGAPSVRLGFLFTLCVRWGGLCTPVCLVWAGGGGALFALGGLSSSPGFVSPAADSPVLSGCLGLSLAGRCGLAAGLLLLVGGGFGCCSPGWWPLLVAAPVMAVASWLAVVRSGNGEGGIVGSGDDLVRSAHPHRRGWGRIGCMESGRQVGGSCLAGSGAGEARDSSPTASYNDYQISVPFEALVRGKLLRLGLCACTFVSRWSAASVSSVSWCLYSYLIQTSLLKKRPRRPPGAFLSETTWRA